MRRNHDKYKAMIMGKQVVSPSSERSDEGLTLETSAFLPFTVANLRFQLSC